MINLTIWFDRRSGTSNFGVRILSLFVTILEHRSALCTLSILSIHALSIPTAMRGSDLMRFIPIDPIPEAKTQEVHRFDFWVFRTLSWCDPRYCPGRHMAVRGCRWPATRLDAAKQTQPKSTSAKSLLCLQCLPKCLLMIISKIIMLKSSFLKKRRAVRRSFSLSQPPQLCASFGPMGEPPWSS